MSKDIDIISIYHTTVITKIRKMPLSLFYDLPRYITMGLWEVIRTSPFGTSEKIRALETLKNYMYVIYI